MAVKTREDLMQSVNTILGDRSDDVALEFIQDMTDTLNDFASHNGVYTQEQYDALDNNWRTRYRERFFSGPREDDDEFKSPNNKKSDEEKREETITINDLFTRKDN